MSHFFTGLALLVGVTLVLIWLICSIGAWTRGDGR